MASVFQLWDVESGNLVGEYQTERDAIAVVCQTLAEYGSPNVVTLALTQETGEGPEIIVQGAELLRRAQVPLRTVPASEPDSR
jgi:hypothetical protein